MTLVLYNQHMKLSNEASHKSRLTKRKPGFLLIDIFKKFHNPQKYGHLITGGHFGLWATKNPAENREAFLLLNVGVCLTLCVHLTTGGLSGHQ